MIEVEMSLWNHIEDLRRVLFRILLCIATGFILAFCFYKPLIEFMLAPFPQAQQESGLQTINIQKKRILNTSNETIHYTLPNLTSVEVPPSGFIEYEVPEPVDKLIVINPIEGMTSAFKVCFWISLVGTSPLWLFWLVQFLAPGLRPQELGLVIPFLFFSIGFILMGFAFAYFLTIPLANAYLMAFNADLGTNLWGLSHYLDYTLLLLLANGLAFELGVIGLFLVHLRVISAQGMREKRRHFILAAFILAALITPPDVLSQVLLAIPLIILYEITILYASLREKALKKVARPSWSGPL